jgi:hypothetical protein
MVVHSNNFLNSKFIEICNIINECDVKHIEISFLLNIIKKYFSFNDFILLITNTIYFNKFISICGIDVELFNYIINTIYKNNKGKYKKDYSVEYKLILIFQVKNTLVKWSDLKKSIFYDPKPGIKYHYKSIHSQYIKWCSNNIFKKAFFNFVPSNNSIDTLNGFKFNENDNNFYIVNNNNDLFIDSTSINNKYGSENIVINPELTKKKITKISTISNVDGFVYSVIHLNVNHKTIKYNNVNKEISTAQNDSKTISVSLSEINPNIIIKSTTNEIDLIGDKGYITNEELTYKNNKINMITPIKKNSKNKFIYRNNKKLMYRYIIENTICSIKRDERINIRKDKKIKTFMGWIYISCLNHNLNVNRRNN